MSGCWMRTPLLMRGAVGQLTKPVGVLAGVISRALAGAGGPPVLLNEPVTVFADHGGYFS